MLVLALAVVEVSHDILAAIIGAVGLIMVPMLPILFARSRSQRDAQHEEIVRRLEALEKRFMNGKGGP